MQIELPCRSHAPLALIICPSSSRSLTRRIPRLLARILTCRSSGMPHTYRGWHNVNRDRNRQVICALHSAVALAPAVFLNIDCPCTPKSAHGKRTWGWGEVRGVCSVSQAGQEIRTDFNSGLLSLWLSARFFSASIYSKNDKWRKCVAKTVGQSVDCSARHVIVIPLIADWFWGISLLTIHLRYLRYSPLTLIRRLAQKTAVERDWFQARVVFTFCVHVTWKIAQHSLPPLRVHWG